MSWALGRIEEIRGHVERGLSRSAIGQIYGVSRNAVVGVCFRNGITGMDNRQATILSNKRRNLNTDRVRRSRAKPPTKPIPQPIVINEPEPLRLSIVEMTDNHCHWVCEGTNDRCMPTCCGHPSVDGRWCQHHYGRVYTVRR